MISSVTVGLVIVFALQGTSLVSASHPPADPIVYFGVGVIALGLAVVIRRRPPSPPKEGDSKVSRLLSRSQKAGMGALRGFESSGGCCHPLNWTRRPEMKLL
jgi:hypothetical protein